jgi:dTDP-4-amino-4,6-dideoxygalactose transaminase
LEAALARAAKTGVAKPRAVIPVHLNGQTCDMVGIAAVAAQHELTVIEDSCHAVGSKGEGPGAERAIVGACTRSAMSAFSFHPVKTITTGEGGMVTTNGDAMAARLSRFRNHGMERDPQVFSQRDEGIGADGQANPWYYEMVEPGFNYRLTDIACALGLSQLRKLPRVAAKRQQLAARYDRVLAPLAPLVRPVAKSPWCDPVLHLYAVLIDFGAAGVTRANLMRALTKVGIGTQVHYLPVHRQPYYRKRYGALSLPGADAYYARCLSLPLQPGMNDADVDRVVDALTKALGT